jgi:hypothetical protein
MRYTIPLFIACCLTIRSGIVPGSGVSPNGFFTRRTILTAPARVTALHEQHFEDVSKAAYIYHDYRTLAPVFIISTLAHEIPYYCATTSLVLAI